MLAFDSTKFGTLLQCPRAYQLSMLEGWRPREDAIPLTFGRLYQKGLEWLDKGIAIEEVVSQLLRDSWKQLPELNEDGNYRTRKNLIRAVLQHHDQFADDRLIPITLPSGEIASELSFRIELPFEINGEKVIYSGHFDKIARRAGSEEIYVVDNKTTQSSLSSWYFKQWDVDVQMTGYTLAASILSDRPIAGVLIDACRVLADSCEFRRQHVLRTPGQLDEFVSTLESWIHLERGFVSTASFPMNLKSCTMCRFREHVCSKDPSVRQMFLEANFEKLPPWDPLETR